MAFVLEAHADNGTAPKKRKGTIADFMGAVRGMGGKVEQVS